MDLGTLLATIASGDVDEHFETIRDAIRKREKIHASQRMAAMRRRLGGSNDQ